MAGHRSNKTDEFSRLLGQELCRKLNEQVTAAYHDSFTYTSTPAPGSDSEDTAGRYHHSKCTPQQCHERCSIERARRDAADIARIFAGFTDPDAW